MKAATRHGSEPITAKANRIAAFAKVSTAPLDKLTDAMLESIARSHAKPGRERERLLAELAATLDHRKAREGFGG